MAENFLDQDSSVSETAMVFGDDITYITTDEGWLYLVGLKDFCTKEIVDYAMGDRMTKELVIEALHKAIRYRKPGLNCQWPGKVTVMIMRLKKASGVR